MRVFSSFVTGKSNIGTDTDICEGFDGESCFIGRKFSDLFKLMVSVLITGDEDDFSSLLDNVEFKSLGAIVVVVPHRLDASNALVGVEHGSKDAFV